jgi:hypothetical protein
MVKQIETNSFIFFSKEKRDELSNEDGIVEEEQPL